MGRGKPITDEDLRRIELLAGFGLTSRQISAVLGMSDRSFRTKKHEARVASALEKGRAVAQHRVAEVLFERALAGDLGAIVWWEKTRAGRSERVIQAVEPGETLEIRIGRAAPGEEEIEARGKRPGLRLVDGE